MISLVTCLRTRLVTPISFISGFEDGEAGLIGLKAAGMEVVDVKLMEGYPRALNSNSKLVYDEKLLSEEDDDDSKAPENIDEEVDNSSESGWVWSLIQNLAILVFLLKVGEYLLKEAIADEALSAD